MATVNRWQFSVSTSWLNLFCGIALIGGCGTSPESRSQPTDEGSARASTSDLSVVDPSMSETSATAPDVSNRETTQVVANEQIDATCDSTPGTPPAAAVQSPTAEPSQAGRPKIEPTPEQLARWKQPAYETEQLLACRESATNAFVTTMANALDGRHYILAGLQVTLWSVDSAVPDYVFLEADGERRITSLSVAPDGKWFAAGDSNGMLRMWSIPDRSEMFSKSLNSNAIIDIAISPNSSELAVISYDDEISIWTADGLQKKNRFKVKTNGLKKIAYLDSELIAAAGETTTTWNVRTGTVEQTLSNGRYNYSLTRSPDNTRLLFGDKDALRFWNIGEMKADGELTGGFATEELIAFSPDGNQFATANSTSVRIWDLSSKQLMQVIDAFGSPIIGLNWLPKTNLIVAASQNSRTRIWGTLKAAQALQMTAMQTAVSMPDGTSHEPATPAQLEQIIDFRTFPRIPGGIARAADASTLIDSVPVDLEEAMLFYRYQLTSAGWAESAEPTSTPGSLQFQKDGFKVAGNFYEEGMSKTSANISLLGTYDLRWVPKLDAAKITTVFDRSNVVIYRTKLDLLAIETTLLRKLNAAGWTTYARLHASRTETEDTRDMEFLRNGLILRVSIGKFPADPTNFNIQYSQTLTARSIPVPPDSGFVEYDGATQPQLVATTSMNLAESLEFYDRQMTAQGWLIREFGRSVTEDQNWMSYVRGQQEVSVGLQKIPSGRTLVRIGEDLENASWQLASLKPTTKADDPKVGLEAADFPILNESKSATFDAMGKTIDFLMNTTPLSEVAEKYTTAMQTLGWKWDGGGIKSNDYVFLTFVNGKAEIALRARMTDSKSTVNVQGDGLLWAKPLPGNGKLISYESWLRSNHHPATLDLLDRYTKEMLSVDHKDGLK